MNMDSLRRMRSHSKTECMGEEVTSTFTPPGTPQQPSYNIVYTGMYTALRKKIKRESVIYAKWKQ